MHPLTAEHAAAPPADYTRALTVSRILQPAVTLPLFLLGQAAGATTSQTAIAVSGMVILPYLVGKRLRAIRLPAHTPSQAKDLLRHTAISLCAIAGVVATAIAGAPEALLHGVTWVMVMSLVLTVIRLRDNASAHVAGITLLTAWTALHGEGLSPLLLTLIPLTAWSRMRLGEHSLREAVIGAMIGAVPRS